MADLLIRDVPLKLKKIIAERAKIARHSISDEIKILVSDGLRSSSATTGLDKPSLNAWQQLRSAFEEAGAVSDEFAEIMDEIEAERKKDFGRPAPDFE